MEEEWRRKTAEAEQREERVRWRRRRMELRGKRIVFWRKENRRVEKIQIQNQLFLESDPFSGIRSIV